MPGSTGPTMISRAPARAATAVAMPKAHCLMRTGLAPIRRKAGSSWATALMARPVKVLDKYSVSRTVRMIAMAKATTRRSGMRISAMVTLLPM